MVRVKESSNGVQIGQSYSSWTVIGPPFGSGDGSAYGVLCRCICGRLAVVQCRHLHGGKSTQCKACHAAKTNTKHGGSRTKAHGGEERLYRIWGNMRQRCTNPKCRAYPDYGGRGITVCAEWSNYEAFRSWAVSNGYADTLSLDRRENDKGYSPNNCRWANRITQARNTRAVRMIEAFGDTKTVADWADDARCVVGCQVLYKRLRLGWDVEMALTTAKTR